MTLLSKVNGSIHSLQVHTEEYDVDRVMITFWKIILKTSFNVGTSRKEEVSS